jgi:hypothetical protein
MKDIWWLHPGKLLLFFLVPVYLFVIYVVPPVWPQLLVLKAGLFVRGQLALLGLMALVGAGVVGMIGAYVSIDSRQADSAVVINPRLLAVIGSLSITAYLIWFYPVLLTGSFTADRTAMNQTPGVTSFTQLGVPFVVCYLVGRLVTGQRFSKLIHLQFFAILVLTLMRVQLWAERLAMIEVAAPMAVLILTFRQPRTSLGFKLQRVVALFGPFLAIPALLLMFTVTEFFRSWTVYSQTQNLPLLEFMTQRLVTYYFTASNNGAGLLATQEGRWPTFNFYYTAEWMYKLPAGIGQALQDATMGREAAHGEFLENFADVEFNNMSGIYPIIYDQGQILGLIYFCAYGLIAGLLYRSLMNRRALGLVFYPPVFVGCVEIMRIAYLNGSRAVLIIFGSVLVYLQVRVARSRVVEGQHLPPNVSRPY